jgi:hypothetical protein
MLRDQDDHSFFRSIIGRIILVCMGLIVVLSIVAFQIR